MRRCDPRCHRDPATTPPNPSLPRCACTRTPADRRLVRQRYPHPPSPASAAAERSAIAKTPNATSSEPAKLATAPSHVFFGLKCGAKGCFPIARPTKYATVSPAHVITNANSKQPRALPAPSMKPHREAQRKCHQQQCARADARGRQCFHQRTFRPQRQPGNPSTNRKNTSCVVPQAGCKTCDLAMQDQTPAQRVRSLQRHHPLRIHQQKSRRSPSRRDTRDVQSHRPARNIPTSPERRSAPSPQPPTPSSRTEPDQRQTESAQRLSPLASKS